jgi:signal peptidase II
MQFNKFLRSTRRGFQRSILVLFVILSCVGCDQASKAIARDILPRSERISLLGDILRLQSAENNGAFLGMGNALPERVRSVIFTGLVAVLLLGLLVCLFYAPLVPSKLCIGLSMIVGGGLSNLLDRIINQGWVFDFLNLGVGVLRTGIFNIADVTVMVGAVLVIMVQHSAVQRINH